MTTDLRQMVEAEIEARANDQTTYAWGGMLRHGKDLPSRILALLDVVDAAKRQIETWRAFAASILDEDTRQARAAEADSATDALRTALAALGSHQGKGEPG